MHHAANIAEIEQQLDALHALAAKGSSPEELYQEWLEVLLWPLTTHYDFADNSAHHDGMLLVKRSLKYWDGLKPLREMPLVNRTISGHYWN